MRRLLCVLSLLAGTIFCKDMSLSQSTATGHGSSFTKIDVPSIYAFRNELHRVQTATINVEFATDVPASIRTPIQEAANVWSYLITTDQPIKIHIEWAGLSGGDLASTQVDTPLCINFPSAPQANTLYPAALAEAIAHQNLNGSKAEFTITVDSTQTNFYTGTDGNPPGKQFDLMSIALHEIGHGLGIYGSFDMNGLIGRWGAIPHQEGLPIIFDKSCIVGNLRGTSIYRLTNTAQYPNPSQALGDQLKGGNVYFDGLNSYQINGNSLPKLYAPTQWSGGSSIAHLDETTYPAGNSNSLMTPTIDSAEVVHSPGEIFMAMLQDMGWTINRCITFTKPIAGMTWQQNQIDTIRWTDNKYLGGQIVIQLWRQNPQGSFDWYSDAISVLSNQGKNFATWTANVPLGVYRFQAMLNANEGYGVSNAFNVSNLPQVAGPVFSPSSGSYAVAQNVSITSGTSGATIHYTIDGTDPTESSPSGTTVTVSQNLTLKARGYKTNFNPSTISIAVYKIGLQATAAQISPASGPVVLPFTVYISWMSGLRCLYTWTPGGGDPPDPFANGTDISNLSSPFGLTFTNSASPIKFKVGTMLPNGTGKITVTATFTIVPVMRIAQVDSAGNSFGNWSRWENGILWRSYPDTLLMRPSSSTTYTVRASQDFKPSTTQKYRTWSLQGTPVTYLNHASISVDQNTSNLLGSFQPAKIATVQAQLIEGGITGGVVNFKDPWQINLNESPYGWRNRGVSPIDTVVGSSQNNLGTSTNFKGVFLNENPTWISNRPKYTATVTGTQPINGYSSMFMKWTGDPNFVAYQDSNALQTGVVFKQTGATATALYKGIHLSNDATAFADNGQRKLVQTRDGWLHQVYESAGRVWLEHSTNGGSTWFLGNNGQPLDNGAGRSPSIDWHYNVSDPNNANLNAIVVAFQQQSGTAYTIPYAVFKYSNGSYVLQGQEHPGPLYTEPAGGDQYASTNAKPNIAWGEYYYFALDFERKGTCGGMLPGIYWIYGFLYESGVQQSPGLPNLPKCTDPVLVNGTTGSSTNSTLALNKLSTTYSDFDIVYQEGSSSIKDVHLRCTQDGQHWIPVQTSSPTVISSAAGVLNYKPSMVQMPDSGFRVCWIRDWYGMGSVTPYYVNVVYWNSINPAVYNCSGNMVNSVSLNLRDGSSNTYYAFAQNTNNSSWQNFASNGSTIIGLNTSGQNIQLCNGPSSANLFASSYYSSTLPYTFHTSNSLGQLQKSTFGLTTYGRGVVLMKGDVQFSYVLKSLTVDNADIQFMDLPEKKSTGTRKQLTEDDMYYPSIDSLNAVLLTEPFSIGANSNVSMSERAGFTDSIAATKVMGPNGYVACRLELIDNTTNKVVARIKELKYTGLGSYSRQLTASSLDVSKLGFNVVKARIIISTNVRDVRGALVNEYGTFDANTLSKQQTNSIVLSPSEEATTYSLSQNFPNPFNPTTTITYRLPFSSRVTLKVYDIVGREVATLVEGMNESGTYSTTFDGTRLASGVYIMQLSATPDNGSKPYVQVSKMILMK